MRDLKIVLIDNQALNTNRIRAKRGRTGIKNASY